MTAGIVHLIAPTAKIMPLKAFRADDRSIFLTLSGPFTTGRDHGANVVSMSFSMAQSSQDCRLAIQYALGKNVSNDCICGQCGSKTLVYPASYGGVQGIGSSTNTIREAPLELWLGRGYLCGSGEGVITTYPGGNTRQVGHLLQYPHGRRRNGTGVAGPPCEQTR